MQHCMRSMLSAARTCAHARTCARACARTCARASMRRRQGQRQALRALTSFSPSPTHLLVSDAALMAKKVDAASCASALASIVLPLPVTGRGCVHESERMQCVGGRRQRWRGRERQLRQRRCKQAAAAAVRACMHACMCAAAPHLAGRTAARHAPAHAARRKCQSAACAAQGVRAAASACVSE